jgi:Coenzyme PQQ synthesis protein D (PqqD)
MAEHICIAAMELLMNQKYKIVDEIVSRNNKDGTIIVMKLDDSNFFFKIDGVAAHVWKEMTSNKQIGLIKEEILASYNTTRETLDGDIQNLLKDLLSNNLIAIVDCE